MNEQQYESEIMKEQAELFYNQVGKIQQALVAPKNQHNSFGKYNYRSCEDILEGFKKLKTGLVLTVSDEIIVVGSGDKERFYIKATATITNGVNSISNSALARESLTKKGMDDSQITGTASSYARKYALNGLFCIDDNKDADTMDNATLAKIDQPQATAIHKLQSDLGVNGIHKNFGANNVEDLTHEQAEQALEKLRGLRSCKETVFYMREMFDKGDELELARYWIDEVDEDERAKLRIAYTKGGPFSTELCNFLKNKAFSIYNGNNEGEEQ